jgi:aquaporin Z
MVHSPGGYPLASRFVSKFVLTAGFIFVIIGATDSRARAGFAGLTIGLTLTLIHVVSIPITNTSVNPARSTGHAVFVGGWPLAQLWSGCFGSPRCSAGSSAASAIAG